MSRVESTWWNGRWMRPEEAMVPVSDRSFLFGDGLFETIRVHQGETVFLEDHLARLRKGAQHLQLEWCWEPGVLESLCQEVLQRNGGGEGMVRLTVSRGSGGQGYCPDPASAPRWLLNWRAAVLPSQLARYTLCIHFAHRVPQDGLNGFKHANKLPQVLARMEAEREGCQDAILLNAQDHVVETSSSNLFVWKRGTIYTPPITSGCLDGVTRARVIEMLKGMDLGGVVEQPISLENLKDAEGIFLTNSNQGVVEAALKGSNPAAPGLRAETARIHQAYWDLVRRSRS